MCLSKWVKEHVDKDPFCILTPIFNDYEKYLKDLDKELETQRTEEKKNEGNEKTIEKPVAKETEKEPAAEGEPAVTKATETSATSTSVSPFSMTSGLAASTAPSPFVFGAQSGASSASPFASTFTKAATGFGGTSGFSFAVGGASAAPAGDQATAEEEEYVPPKAEVKEISEEGSFYTKRCKLFYQKDNQWNDKGIGNLHLKTCDGKTQLIVRADTNLGNILLNIMLTESIPVKTSGKNNVSLFCVPNPPMDPKDDDKKPMSLLLRVKTAEDMEELYNKLKENQS